MNRVELKNGCRVILSDNTGRLQTYVIKNLLSRQGTTCLCYLATDINEQDIILKEFYPSNKNISRLEMNLDIPSAAKKDIELFRKGYENLIKVLTIPGTEKYICADLSTIKLLKGNGTLYYTNSIITGTSLKEIAAVPNIFLDQVLISFIGILDFLELLHNEGFAYPDLKPEDILIPFEEKINIYKFDNPMFYDFDAMVEFGVYEEVSHTNGPFKHFDGPYSIDIISDNKTIANILDSLIHDNKRLIRNSREKKLIRRLTTGLRNDSVAKPEKESKDQIEEIINSIQTQRHIMEKQGFMKDFRMLKWAQCITCVLVSLIYLFIGGFLLSVFFVPEFISELLGKYCDVLFFTNGNIFLSITIIMM